MRVYQVAINIAWVFESFAHRALCNFIEGDTTDAAIFLSLLLFLLAAGAISAQFFRQVPRDGLSLSIRVGGEIDSVRALRQLLQSGDDFFLTRNNDVISFEIVVDVNAESTFRQIFDVA